jgi:hypothetical protein
MLSLLASTMRSVLRPQSAKDKLSLTAAYVYCARQQGG